MTIKKKTHSAYGAFYKDIDNNEQDKDQEEELKKRRRIVF